MKTQTDPFFVGRWALALALGLVLSVYSLLAQEAAPAPAAEEEYVPLPAIGSPESDLDFQTYRLSYMQSDRVIALLKALGYATVEFSASQGELKTENIYSLVQDSESFPLIIKLIDASKTSLFQPAEDGGSSKDAALGDTLGGTTQH